MNEVRQQQQPFFIFFLFFLHYGKNVINSYFSFERKSKTT